MTNGIAGNESLENDEPNHNFYQGISLGSEKDSKFLFQLACIETLSNAWECCFGILSLVDDVIVSQGRMKLPGSTYIPCYKIES